MKKLTIEKIVDESEQHYEKRNLDDGVYNASNVKEVFELDVYFDVESLFETETSEKLIEFCTKYPNWCIASPYETNCTLFLSNRPSQFQGERIGSGFNYGSCNFLENCPSKLLILAEND